MTDPVSVLSVALADRYPLEREPGQVPGTGRRTPPLVIAPRDRAGLLAFNGLTLADDARAYAYVDGWYTSTLLVAERAR